MMTRWFKVDFSYEKMKGDIFWMEKTIGNIVLDITYVSIAYVTLISRWERSIRKFWVFESKIHQIPMDSNDLLRIPL